MLFHPHARGHMREALFSAVRNDLSDSIFRSPSRDKSVVYPAMHWCLERLPQLKKRAYLARYLMPVEVPVDFMQDQALIDLHESYKEMQVSRFTGAKS